MRSNLAWEREWVLQRQSRRGWMDSDHPQYRWIALSNTTLGMLMATTAGSSEAFWTIGTYDSVGVFNAPDDETATASAIALSYASLGNGWTTTLRAFNRDEMTQIVQRTT